MTRPTKKPRWASTLVANGPGGSNNVEEPSEAKKDLGWNYQEKPPREYFNWLSSVTNNWIDNFDLEVNQFVVYQSDPTTPDMTIKVGAGRLVALGSLVSKVIQTSGTITAPTTNDRIDRVLLSKADGTISIVSGSESATPTAPAITAGYVSLAQIYLTPAHTEIINDDITDERTFGTTGGLSAQADEVITGSWRFNNGLTQFGSAAPGSAWHSSWDVLEISATASLGGSGTGINIAENAYFDGTWKYLNTDSASTFTATNGNLHLYTAASGTAGTAITWKTALKAESDGSVKMMGGTCLISPDGADITPTFPLHIHRNSATTCGIRLTHTGTGSSSSDGALLYVDSLSRFYLMNYENTDFLFGTYATVKGKISSTGNWLISPDGNDITPSQSLHIYKNSDTSTYLRISNSAYTSGVDIGIATGGLFNLWSYINADMRFAVNNQQEMYLDSSNRGLVVGSPTGAGQGAGSGNFESLYVNGSKILAGTIVSGFVNGTSISIHDSGSSASNFDIDANIGGAPETIGATGSGATNIWTVLDDVPSNAKAVILDVSLSLQGYGVVANYNLRSEVKFYQLDSIEYVGLVAYACGYTSNTSANYGPYARNKNQVTVPIINRKFNCEYSTTKTADTGSPTFSESAFIKLAGWIE